MLQNLFLNTNALLKTISPFIQKVFAILMIITLSFTDIALLKTNTYASDPDFETNHSLEIYYQPNQDYVEVKERLRLQVNTSLYLYPAGYMQEMYITPISSEYQNELFDSEMAFSRDSLQVYVNGQTNNSYQVENTPQGIKVLIPQDYNIDNYNPFEAEIRYKSHQFIDINGNISNIYTPQMPTLEDSKTDGNGLKTNYNYTQKILVPENESMHSYYSPSSIQINTENGYRIYTLDHQTIKNNMGWVQIGTEQYTYFKIEQKAPISDNLIPESISNISPLLSTNVYEIILPREFEETNQEIYIKSISPEPKLLYHDDEGNLIGRWEVPANKESTITIEGYVKQSIHKDVQEEAASTNEESADTQEIKSTTEVTLTDLATDISTNQTLSKFLESDTYWQTTDPEIIQLANSLKADKEKIYDILISDYNYLVEEFDYSYDKVSQFNQRIGALRALEGEATVCMEYSDSLITLLRAQGIPARPAFGYGNDPLLDNEVYNSTQQTDVSKTESLQENEATLSDTTNNTNSNESDENKTVESNNEDLNQKSKGHQWVQVWFPDYGWMTVDPTWGETKRIYIGPDLEHVLWYTSSSISTSPIDAMVYSANITAENAYDNYHIIIYPVPASQFSEIGSLKTVDQIATISDLQIIQEQDKLDFMIKTNPLGKTAIVVLPVCVTLVIFIVIITLIASQIRKYNKKRLMANTTSNDNTGKDIEKDTSKKLETKSEN